MTQEEVADIQRKMEDAMIAVENAIGECVTELDPDDLLDAGTHILGDKHPAVRNLRKWIKKLDHGIDSRVKQYDINATYTSVFDGEVICTSDCMFNTKTRNCFDIELADNEDDAENADAMTDEYVTVDGKQLRKSDGVTFDY